MKEKRPPGTARLSWLLGTLMLLVALSSVVPYPIGKPDTWIQIATRDYILSRGIPHTDPFSYTTADRPYVEHEWLTCVLFALVYRTGGVLGLVLLYEIHDIRRFPEEGQFLSYARLVRCAHESAGKKQGTGGNKIGNAHLKWAFSEATCLLLRSCPKAKAWLTRREKKHGKKRALGALAARLGRAVYHLLRKGEAFDEGRFFAS